MSRSELREHVFRMLFRIEFNNEDEMKEQEELYFELLGEIITCGYTYLRLIMRFKCQISKLER